MILKQLLFIVVIRTENAILISKTVLFKKLNESFSN